MWTLLVLLLLLSATANARQGPPSWSSAYTVQGTIFIPFAEVEEPFAAFYDGAGSKSRIDVRGFFSI
jgi:hypothetical protein